MFSFTQSGIERKHMTGRTLKAEDFEAPKEAAHQNRSLPQKVCNGGSKSGDASSMDSKKVFTCLFSPQIDYDFLGT